jgi:hypothetical protein
MIDPETSRIDLSRVIERFPADTKLILRLAKENETFLSMCEDYSLATTRLARLLSLNRSVVSAEIEEYQDIISELGREIEISLRDSRWRR